MAKLADLYNFIIRSILINLITRANLAALVPILAPLLARASLVACYIFEPLF
jgi:hypothetical protein